VDKFCELNWKKEQFIHRQWFLRLRTLAHEYELQHLPTTGPNLKKTMGRKSKPGESRTIFRTRWMGHVPICCMSFPVDILGKAFFGSFRFSRNDANCKGHIEQSLNHWGHPSGSISEAIADARRSFYLVLQLEKKSYDPRVWMRVKQNLRQTDRHQHYATGTSICCASNVVGEQVGGANWHAAQLRRLAEKKRENEGIFQKSEY
jgi:hypothetical protein